MDKSMRQHSGDDTAVVSALDAQYRSTLKFLFTAFQGNPFVLPETTRPSRPAYDALMVACSLVDQGNLAAHEGKIRTNFHEAARTPSKYEVLVGRGNTVEAIRERVNLARDILAN
jgi:hypothetical protein